MYNQSHSELKDPYTGQLQYDLNFMEITCLYDDVCNHSLVTSFVAVG